MKYIKKLLFNLNMSWKNLIIYAIVTALVVGLTNCIPFLHDTSFTLPAATADVWIFLALVIICNSKSRKEAILKTFIYFVISQPLIYLVEVPFNSLGFGLFRYYPYWAKITILTIPGSALAYEVKKSSLLGTLTLSIANALLSLTAIYYTTTTISEFPKYLLGTIFCYTEIVILIEVIIKEKKYKYLSYILVVISTILSIYITYMR